MEERHKKILKKKYKDLTKDLRPDDVMDHLIQEDIFELNDLELVRAEKVNKLQVEKMLSILFKRGPNAFHVFLESLEERYPWLYKDLKKADEESATKQPLQQQPQPQPQHAQQQQQQQPQPKQDETTTSSSEARHPEQETTRPSSDQLVTPEDQTCVTRPLPEPGTQTREKAVVQRSGGGSGPPLTDEEKVAQEMAKLQVNNRRQYIPVPPEVSSRRVTEKQLNTLAGRFGNEWENLAIHLDLTKADVDRYKADNPYNSRSQIFSMLMGWRARKGAGATVGALIRNLEEFGVALDTFEFLTQKS